MLDFLGEVKVAKTIEGMVEKVLSERKVRSRDLGGDSSTIEVGDEVVRKLKEIKIK
jgi:isocitrate/isopropylmalate dehydrogenase